MGPGSFDPGNAQCPNATRRHDALQWGRGLLTPEMNTFHAKQQYSSVLQWGRGLLTPEIKEKS